MSYINVSMCQSMCQMYSKSVIYTVYIYTLKTYIIAARQSAKLCNFNCYLLEGVPHYNEPQIQVGENNSFLFNLRPKICKS